MYWLYKLSSHIWALLNRSLAVLSRLFGPLNAWLWSHSDHASDDLEERAEVTKENDIQPGERELGLVCGEEKPSHQNKISHGIFATVHKLSDCRVRKVPATSDIYDQTAIRTESRIYRHLGEHPRILQTLACGDDYVDLLYMKNGNLEDYLRSHHPASSKVLRRFARQTVEAVDFIYEKEIVHSDLAARQFLVDDFLDLRLSDFGGSSIQGSEALGLEGTTHFLPRDDTLLNTIQSDIFALGSTIYEIFCGKRPYEGKQDDEIHNLFKRSIFPGLGAIEEPWGSIIAKCWNCQYNSTNDILLDLSYS
ncbi:serine/threonine protein kinase [Polytolypa hystricis UAMH7299]|uniref:Serine/threonine protein kinase n=1 Tax=Polytolypa hystricis (strain UAMH7299) TaxID=1447883 RepID=A0A2B7XPS9_POLH7|nr:serine/threonine protein kinase [Polytolypa hystricis UAMH7299]